MFFATAASRRVQSSLLAGLETRQGCLFLITGEAGIGKTMQLHVLEAVLRVAGETVMVHDGADASASWLDRLAEAKVDAKGRPVVDLVDGAESFSAATIDRLVSALRAAEGRGFPPRLVIAARSEIEPRLYSLVGAALSTGVSFNWLRLDGVDGFDVESLVLHRLRRAGYTGASPLDPETLRRIIDGAGGVPGRILDLAARELDPQWRKVEFAGTVDDGSRARPRQVRRAFAAASLPLLVAGAWMLLPIDVIRRAESSAGRFVVETFAGTPMHVAQETSAAITADASSEAAAPPPAPSEPILARGIEDDTGEQIPMAIVHLGAERIEDAGATASSVIVPERQDPAGDEPEMAVVHPVVVDALIEMPPTGVAAPSPSAVADAPPAVLAQASAVPVLTGEQVAALIRRGDEQLREGSIAGARLFYERAAVTGDPKAMRALARTFDPDELRRLGVVGLSADPERARFWSKKADDAEAAAASARAT